MRILRTILNMGVGVISLLFLVIVVVLERYMSKGICGEALPFGETWANAWSVLKQTHFTGGVESIKRVESAEEIE